MTRKKSWPQLASVGFGFDHLHFCVLQLGQSTENREIKRGQITNKQIENGRESKRNRENQKESERNGIYATEREGREILTNDDCHRCMAAKTFGKSETISRPTQVQDRQFICNVFL